jgi:N-acetylglucosaminyl-diphospho-decaprenol L-rhamnosyltransferase
MLATQNNHLNSVTFIVIVNYKTPDLVIQCLTTMVNQYHALNGGKVIVVDNYSQDDSVLNIKQFVDNKSWSAWVDVLPMPRNGGFAYGCNAGIRHAVGLSKLDYIMLLNPDTMVRDFAVLNLVQFMQSNQKVGIAGSLIENADGGIESSAHQFHTPIGDLLDGAQLGFLTKFFSAYDVTPIRQEIAHQCDWVSGSSMIIRRSVIDEIGLLDEAFFLYFEEVDFFFRAAKAGWQTWYVPTAKVMHIEGASTGIKEIKRRPQYWYESRRRFILKHHGVFGLVISDTLWGIGRISYLVRRLFKLGTFNTLPQPKNFTLDLLWGDFKAIFSGKVFNIAQEKIIF